MEEKKLEHFEAAQHRSWWDGPDWAGNVNRNPIAWIQKRITWDFVMGLYLKERGCRGIEVGGQGDIGKGCLGLQPYQPADIIDDGRTLKTIANESIDYILNNHTFEHLDQPPVKTLVRWLEVLKRGGMIVTIMPDKTHFTHDPNDTREFWHAPNEMSPEDMLTVLNELRGCKVRFLRRFKMIPEYPFFSYSKYIQFEIVSFNTHQNNFDFETIIRKLC